MAARIACTRRRSGKLAFLTGGVVAGVLGMSTAATATTSEPTPLLQPEATSTTSATWRPYAEVEAEAQAAAAHHEAEAKAVAAHREAEAQPAPVQDENEYSGDCCNNGCSGGYSTSNW